MNSQGITKLKITDKTTVVTGAATTQKWLLIEINGKNAAIPLYTFDYSIPPIDLIIPPTDFIVENATLANASAEYGAGIIFNWHSTENEAASAIVKDYALPIWSVSASNINPTVRVDNAVLGGSTLTITPSYLVASINNVGYGIPLATYDRVYPFTQDIAPSAVNVTTDFIVNRTTVDVPKSAGSTNLNSKIKTYSELINRIKTQIGYPFVNIEVCDDTQIVEFIDLAMEWYTKYAGYTEEFLIFNSELYKEPGLKIDDLFSITPTMRQTLADGTSACWDYDLGDYRKVIGIHAFEPGESTGINTLFTLEQAMAQQTYFSYMLGNVGFDLVTWEVLKQWLDLRTKVLAQTHYVDFDENRQLLRLIPSPNKNSRFYGIVGCWVEKPIAHLIREQWIQKYALALTKIAVGNVRGKYQGMQMFGGGTINYNDLLSQGLKEKDDLERGLQEGEWYDTAPPRFFIG